MLKQFLLRTGPLPPQKSFQPVLEGRDDKERGAVPYYPCHAYLCTGRHKAMPARCEP